MFLLATTRKGVAAKRVERELGVTYKTAWRMCHQVRKYRGAPDSDDPLGGPGSIVRIDGTMIGGDAKQHRKTENKTLGLGMRENAASWSRVSSRTKGAARFSRTSRRTSFPAPPSTPTKLGPIIRSAFEAIGTSHAAGEYVSANGCTVNAIEGFWSMLKRGINGIHIHFSSKRVEVSRGV